MCLGGFPTICQHAGSYKQQIVLLPREGIRLLRCLRGQLTPSCLLHIPLRGGQPNPTPMSLSLLQERSASRKVAKALGPNPHGCSALLADIRQVPVVDPLTPYNNCAPLHPLRLATPPRGQGGEEFHTTPLRTLVLEPFGYSNVGLYRDPACTVGP